MTDHLQKDHSQKEPKKILPNKEIVEKTPDTIEIITKPLEQAISCQQVQPCKQAQSFENKIVEEVLSTVETVTNPLEIQMDPKTGYIKIPTEAEMEMMGYIVLKKYIVELSKESKTLQEKLKDKDVNLTQIEVTKNEIAVTKPMASKECQQAPGSSKQSKFCKQLEIESKYIEINQQNPSASKKQKTELICPTCTKKFSNKSSLNKHIATVHEKSETFVCDSCTKTFTRKADMKKHISAVHLKIKDLKCPTCDRKFALKHHLKEHIEIVHEEKKPYKCTTCEKSFGIKKNLKRHESIHIAK